MLKYYDAAATTPTHPLVVEAMLPYFTEKYGNPSSNHELGKQARIAVELAREQVAELLHVHPDEVVFTSGATEAINLGIFGFWMANRSRGNHIITIATEHAAVLNTCVNLEQFGVEITRLSVNRFGQIDYDELDRAIRKETLLVAAMHVNNETGLIHNVVELSEICANNGIAFFTDATQAIGHIEVDYSSSNITMLGISGHKFRGPKGVGALVIKRGAHITPIIHGGGQEKGIRSGTIPTPLVVGFGQAAAITMTNFSLDLAKIELASRTLEARLENEFDAEILVPRSLRSAHIIPVTIKNKDPYDFLHEVYTNHEIIASQGSACGAGTLQQSHVLTSMLGGSETLNFIRFSLT